MENQLTEKDEREILADIRKIKKEKIAFLIQLRPEVLGVLKKEAERLNYNRKSYCEMILIEKAIVLARLESDVKEFLETEKSEPEII